MVNAYSVFTLFTQTFPRNGLADELGGPQQATLPHGYYDQQEEDEEEEDDE